MNFQDLYKRIAAMEGGVGVMAAPSGPTMGEELEAELDECGDMMPMGASSPKGEEDHVSVNVNMSGSGSGGIRDLMNILRNIEDTVDDEPQHHPDEEPVFGNNEMEEEFDPAETFQANTTPEPEYAGIDAVTATGNDLASKGIEAPKVNGGGNPMQEALVQELTQRYNEIKNS